MTLNGNPGGTKLKQEEKKNTAGCIFSGLLRDLLMSRELLEQVINQFFQGAQSQELSQIEVSRKEVLELSGKRKGHNTVLAHSHES